LKGVNTNERYRRIWTSYWFYLGSLYSVDHHTFHQFHNLIGSFVKKGAHTNVRSCRACTSVRIYFGGRYLRYLTDQVLLRPASQFWLAFFIRFYLL
jgi:hypothetical protein